MNKLICSLIGLFSLCSLSAQGLLPGIVTYQNSRNNPVAGALVKAGLTHRQETAKDGTFLLTIPGKPDGYEVILTVEKDGFGVVNKKELFATLKADPSQRLKLYICPEGEWERNALAYYQINEAPLTLRYRQQVARIRAELADQEQRLGDSLALLAEQYDIARAQAEELAEKFAIANLDAVSDLYEAAFDSFTAGNAEAAMALLTDEKLADLQARIEREQAEGKELIAIGQEKLLRAEEAIRQGIENYVLKARLCVVAFRFDEADRNFRKAVGYDSLDFELNFEYGVFLQKQNRFGPATRQYNYLLSLNLDSAQRITTLNNLGSAYIYQNQYSEGIQAYAEALKIRRKLAQKNPQVYLPFVANTLNNLGIAYIDQNQYGEGIQAYEEALKIYRKLAQQNPKVYLPFVAMTLNNLGNAYKNQNQYAEGIPAYQEALKLYRTQAQQNPKAYLPEVATILNNLGIVYTEQNQYGEGIQVYTEALKIRRKLAQKNPQVYLSDVAMTLNNLGVAYTDRNQYGEAIQAYVEAMKIRRKLAQQNPKVYLPDVAMTLNNLGVAYKKQNQYGEAIQAYAEALKIYRKLAQHNPQVYLPHVAMTLNNLGIAYTEQNQFQQGLPLLEEALQIRMSLARQQRTRFGLDATQTLLALSLFNYQQREDGYTEKALAYLDQADSLLLLCPESYKKEQYQAYSQQIRSELSAASNPLTALYKKIEAADSYAEKVRLQAELIGLLTTALQENGPDAALTQALAQAYGSQSWYLLFTQDFANSEAAARKGLTLDPSQTWINSNLATALLLKGKFKEAKALYATWKDQPYDEDRSWREVFLFDLDELEAAGAIPAERRQDVDRIRTLLKK